MQTVHNPREKYSNLLFFLFNALFLLAIFWLLPALGSDAGQPVTPSGQMSLHARSFRQQPEKRIIAQSHSPNLLTQSVKFSLSKLPH